MFITLSMIVWPWRLKARVGRVPAPGLAAASASSSSAACRTLRRKRRQRAAGDLGVRQSTRHAASEDWPYMSPTSCVGERSEPRAGHRLDGTEHLAHPLGP